MDSSNEQIQKAWELLEAGWPEQFWCITSVSWESNNELIVTLNWDISSQVRMILDPKKTLGFILTNIRKGKKRYRKPGEHGPI